MDDLERKIRRVKESGLFDCEWYLKQYPDVAGLGIDPIEHYLRWGARLARQPSAEFAQLKSRDAATRGAAGHQNPLLAHLDRLDRCEGQTRSRTKSTLIPAALRALPSRSDSPALPKAVRRKLPITALVIAWDIGHNPLGRAYMLAEVLDRVVRNVVLAGFQFPRYGNAVWEPLRNGRLPVIPLQSGNFPEFLDNLETIAKRLNPDIVFACKARLPSVQLGAMIKQRLGCPLVIDIDDHELSFFPGATPLPPAHLANLQADNGLSQEPYERIWTQLAHGLLDSADQIIVSNPALQREFGGTVVPHVRDELTFDPSLHNREASRVKYGVPTSAKVTLFLGTPRAHKGIQALAQAVGRQTDPEHRLVIVGTATDKRDLARLNEFAPGRVILIPNQPFAAIPEIVAMADVVCLPQDLSSPVSKYQLPAKAIDAIAMNVPLLVVPTESMGQLIADGLATPVDPSQLSDAIATAVETPRRGREAGARRAAYLASYSYSAAADTLHTVIERATAGAKKRAHASLQELIRHQHRLFRALPSENGAQERKGACVVMFWKQNDTTLYGRRHDMTIRYLASRSDVEKVVVFDAPISEHDLMIRRNKANEPTQDRLVYIRTYQKVAGSLDADKVAYRVFAYPPGRYRAEASVDSAESLTAEFANYVSTVLRDEGVNPAGSIFWVYPRNYHAPFLIDWFKPARVVVDVVDDHRSWPDVSEQERRRLTENYRDILSRATLALANCEPVLKAMHPHNPRIRLVPNGCDDGIRVVAPVGAPAFEEVRAFRGKVIGFVGNLEKKLDLDLIGKLADHFPECLVLLIGSTHTNPEVSRLLSHPNIRLPGVIPYELVGAWVSQFDVGIIPHLNTEQTKSMNPLKLYVYLSLGVPVVCTEIFNIDRSSKAVRVGSTHADFIVAVAQTLSETCVGLNELQGYVQDNAWDRRLKVPVDDILDSSGAGL